MAKTNTIYFINAVAKAKEAQVIITHSDASKSLSYKIVSFSDDDKTYNVSVRKRKIADGVGTFIASCDCPHHAFRQAICKHMIAVSLEHDIDILALSRDRIAFINKNHKLKLKEAAIQSIETA